MCCIEINNNSDSNIVHVQLTMFSNIFEHKKRGRTPTSSFKKLKNKSMR